ncbi:MAG TPA: sugar transferase [Solirubrobacteraceae bacterium]|nr:sugar transferase [Solirubrobacteraceae bacterium]
MPIFAQLVPALYGFVGALAVLLTEVAVGISTAPAWGVASAAGLATLTLAAAGWVGERGGWRLRLVVVGTMAEAERLASELERAGKRGYEVLGAVGIDRLESALAGGRVDQVVFSAGVCDRAVFSRLGRLCLADRAEAVRLSVFHERVFGAVPLAEIDPSWFVSALSPLHGGRGYERAKRALDIVVVVPLLVCCAPLIVLFAALISIRDEQRGARPGIFKQQRVGRGGVPFTLYKLRTMTAAGDASAWAVADDERVTSIGAFLRKTHLDELPQLINILKGEMTLVGPRPEQVAHVAALSQELPFFPERHRVTPGLTGWAQVRCGYAGTVEESAYKLCHDLYYMRHRSLTLDLAILVETARTLVADRQFGLTPITAATMLGRALPAAVDSSATPGTAAIGSGGLR